MSTCCVETCDKHFDHRHHITYKPPVIVLLCRKHHEDITIVNGQEARKLKRKLSTKQRWIIWRSWLRGDLIPQRTPEAMEYIRRWDDPRTFKQPKPRKKRTPKVKLLGISKFCCDRYECRVCHWWRFQSRLAANQIAEGLADYDRMPQNRCTGLVYEAPRKRPKRP